MKKIIDYLNEYKNEKNALFQAKLTPNINKNMFLGVKIPDCRKVAKQIKGSQLEKDFLNELPHNYYDEYILHAVILNQLNDFDVALKETIKFLPYVDNWAVCDTMHSKGLGKNKMKLFEYINKWIKSGQTYTIRFGVGCLMNYFLDDDSFKIDHLKLVGSIKTDEYYINMMSAWYYATALAKQYDKTIKFLEDKILSPWVQNKTIQKAKESFRITNEQKQYLNSLKIK